MGSGGLRLVRQGETSAGEGGGLVPSGRAKEPRGKGARRRRRARRGGKPLSHIPLHTFVLKTLVLEVWRSSEIPDRTGDRADLLKLIGAGDIRAGRARIVVLGGSVAKREIDIPSGGEVILPFGRLSGGDIPCGTRTG